MTHTEFLSSILRTVRASGAAVALEQLRTDRPAFHAVSPTVGTDEVAAYHDTRAVFYVWAIDRLVTGGLSDFGVLWHPLLDSRSPLVWWTAATLATPAATEHFVAAELARPSEPQPVELLALVAA
jgi:hypothetical protein